MCVYNTTYDEYPMYSLLTAGRLTPLALKKVIQKIYRISKRHHINIDDYITLKPIVDVLGN